jgi:hypothetical protein
MSLPLMPAPIDMVHVPYRDRGQGDPRRQHQAGVIQPSARSGPQAVIETPFRIDARLR